jgi:putative endonuclease
MTKNARQSLGIWGEGLAANYLEDLGYTIIARNIRTPHGEIDLIVRQGNLIVFIEVKTRSSSSLGPPEVSVTPRKQAHILASAQHYIQHHPDQDNDWRIDVIAIQRQEQDRAPLITHFENAIT